MDSLSEFAAQFGIGFTAALVLVVVVLAALRKWVPHLKIFNGKSKESYEELRKISQNTSSLNKRLENVEQKVEVLYEWHSVTDEDGVKIWYVRRSLEGAVLRLSDAIVQLSDSVKEIVLIQKEMRRDIDDLAHSVNDLYKRK